MGRRKSGRLVDGILLLDKPVGISSNQVLMKVRWIFNAQKIGHGGTLDPFAEGLLPILLGEATKFGKYFLEGDKTYRVTMRFGSETDTEDSLGKVIHTAAIPDLSAIDWAAIFAPFIGEIQQVPPIYSALKIDGKRAYDLARKGEPLEMQARAVRIDSIELVSIDIEQSTLMLDISCGKGTYIRSLVRDIARSLDSAAHAIYLRRTKAGHVQSAMQNIEHLQTLRDAQDFEALDDLLLPLETCVAHLPRADVLPEKLPFIRHGNDIETCLEAGDYALYGDGQFFGVGVSCKGRLIPQRLCRLEQ